MRLLLVFTFLFYQAFSFATASSSTSHGISHVESVDHHHNDGAKESHGIDDFHRDHGHDEYFQEIGLSHQHKHRHSPEEGEHTHTHHHCCGQVITICMEQIIAFQLSPYLSSQLDFFPSDDKAAQSPYLGSVFRPPIV